MNHFRLSHESMPWSINTVEKNFKGPCHDKNSPFAVESADKSVGHAACSQLAMQTCNNAQNRVDTTLLLWSSAMSRSFLLEIGSAICWSSTTAYAGQGLSGRSSYTLLPAFAASSTAFADDSRGSCLRLMKCTVISKPFGPCVTWFLRATVGEKLYSCSSFRARRRT